MKPAARAAATARCALMCAAVFLAAGAERAAAQNAYADEDRDWGVAPADQLRLPPYHAPTPLQIPGAQVVQTRQLRAMQSAPGAPVLIDVLSEPGHVTLSGAVWLAGVGRGANFVDPAQSLLVRFLARLTGGDKARRLVFFCASSQCWLSYNAALRAVAAGYSGVYWYRGGVEAWVAAGLPTARTPGTP